MTTDKWFYQIQTQLKSWLHANYSQVQCDWQDVVESEGIVYEKYTVYKEADKTWYSILCTLTKQNNDFDVYIHFK